MKPTLIQLWDKMLQSLKISLEDNLHLITSKRILKEAHRLFLIFQNINLPSNNSTRQKAMLIKIQNPSIHSITICNKIYPLRNQRKLSQQKKNNQDILKDLEPSIKLKCVKTGNLLDFACLNRAALSLMVLMN